MSAAPATHRPFINACFRAGSGRPPSSAALEPAGASPRPVNRGRSRMTTATTQSVPERSLGRRMLNKVPEITLWFWIIKILCTTVGETVSDYLTDTVGWGLTKTTWVTAAVLVVVLGAQFRLRRYVPA